MEYPRQINDRIKITQNASEKLKELLKDNQDASAIRLFVIGGGCSGMSYSMSFANEQFETDSTYEQQEVKLLLDPIALNYLSGVEVDYSENEMGASFLFNNVFEIIGGTGGCAGCGSTQS